MLGAAALLLAGILVAQASSLVDDREADGATSGTQRALDMPELKTAAIWPDASKIAADGHSLFLSKITAVPPPAAPVEPPQPEQPPPEPLALVAVLIAPAGKFALLRAQQSQELAQVQEGAAIGGWNLAAVEANRVILEHGGQQTTLYLPDTMPDNP